MKDSYILAYPEYKDGIISLWREAFPEDDTSYIQAFLREMAGENGVLAVMEGDTLVSMLSLIPAYANIDGNEHKGYYIYAVATKASHKGRGLASGLLNYCERFTRESLDAEFLILTPRTDELYSFYRKRGFTVEFETREYRIESASNRTDLMRDMTSAEFERMRRRYLDTLPFSVYFKGGRSDFVYNDLKKTGVYVKAAKNGESYIIYDEKSVYEVFGGDSAVLLEAAGAKGCPGVTKKTALLRFTGDKISGRAGYIAFTLD